MSDTAAHLVDRVLPKCAYRQWVVTFPNRVRYHLAADPRLASEALTQILRTIFAWLKQRARRDGHRSPRIGRSHSTGAVSFVQRFNSALQAALHFHILVADGVFLFPGGDPDARPRFAPIDPPTDADVAALLDKIIDRIRALFARRGRPLDDNDLDDPDPDLPLLCASRPARRLRNTPRSVDDLPPRCARKDGYSLHANTAVHPNDRQGLENLCRYGLRPALALERLSLDEDGHVLYRMKRTFSDGTHTIRLTPEDFLLRLSALIPMTRA